MQDICIYQIEVQGWVEADDLSASPCQITIKQMSPDRTQLTIIADQSGLMGLMRYLHRIGLVFCSVRRESKNSRGHEKENLR
jgi:hypothetical protein